MKDATLQRTKASAGLAVANLKVYLLSFQIHFLETWLDPEDSVSSQAIEESIVSPIRLKYKLFSGLTPKKNVHYCLDPLAYSVTVWKATEKLMRSNLKWNSYSPIWRNKEFIACEKPFISDSWSKKDIYSFKDIYNVNGLLCFQEICLCFNVPGS